MKKLKEVTNARSLRALAKAGQIVWPVPVNNSKLLPFKYVDEVEGIGSNFSHKGTNYTMRYKDGCFFPFLYKSVSEFIAHHGITDERLRGLL